MLTACTELLRELQSKINILSRDPGAGLARIEKILGFINQVFLSMKSLMESYVFQNQYEEITFFKEITPELYAHWVFYSTIYNVQSHAYPASSKHRLKYFEHELKKIDDFFFHHIEFYKYYRAGRNHRDVEFFTRQEASREFNTDLLAPVMDQQFCTPYSLKLAMVIANEKLKSWLSSAISAEVKPEIISTYNSEPPLPVLQWTGTKTGLCEMIYAWYASGVFNNGNATIESITRHCEKFFSIELSAQTVTFQEILRRKKGPTTFIDWLKSKYIFYIESIESAAIQRNINKK
ncbi:RteC domain-containing protein [Chitinophaga alhagiae]|uniref:RteC domain-containing protein n=1 Tax=Chitinophaga alhagiae TaxID=2203219 RepID=UPI000E5A7BD2|nr:RteC domain-containing protein [Chitinophaga alhagiae]